MFYPQLGSEIYRYICGTQSKKDKRNKTLVTLRQTTKKKDFYELDSAINPKSQRRVDIVSH